MMDECARRYYLGFKFKENMYTEEMKELDDMYSNKLDQLIDRLDDLEGTFLTYMEEFVRIKREIECVEDKLGCLRKKRFGSAPV